MSTVASLFRPPLLQLARRPRPSSVFIPPLLRRPFRIIASAASFDELNAKGKLRSNVSKKSVLSDLIQEIEPLDVSLIQKDVPADTVDAMKRTISGMLGLLPSDQFHVLIEAFWDPLSKLLVSSMMTGYTLWNAEYRLCLEKNLDIYEGHFGKQRPENVKMDGNEMFLDKNMRSLNFSPRNELLPELERIEKDPSSENVGVQGLGEMTSEAREYILYLQSCVSSLKNELYDIKRKYAALQMQHFVGEEKNDLLDYLRSLQPEKVAELSEPTSPELQETIHSVIHGLLATLSPAMHSKAPLSDNATTGTINSGNEDFVEVVENASLPFQPLVSVTRDYLARLLFWCMLLGHYLRGLEYRIELMRMLSLSGDVEPNCCDGKDVA